MRCQCNRCWQQWQSCPGSERKECVRANSTNFCKHRPKEVSAGHAHLVFGVPRDSSGLGVLECFKFQDMGRPVGSDSRIDELMGLLNLICVCLELLFRQIQLQPLCLFISSAPGTLAFSRQLDRRLEHVCDMVTYCVTLRLAAGLKQLNQSVQKLPLVGLEQLKHSSCGYPIVPFELLCC